MTHRIDQRMNRFSGLRLLACGLLACIPLGVMAAERVTVQAVGLSTLAAGTPVEEAHRRALQDALRNAVQQAGASVNSHARVEGQMLVERSLTVSTHGRVESAQVIESGILADRPEVYRVVIDAVVRGEDASDAVVAEYADDAWRPRVMLRFDTGQPLNVVMSHGPQLQQALGNAGVEVIEDIAAPGALVLDLRLRSLGRVTLDADMAPGSSDADVFDVAWTLGFPSDNGVEVGLVKRPLAASGEWMVAVDADATGLWWDRFAVQIAQHALRLWNTPHWVDVTVYGLADEELPALERLPGVEMGRRRAAASGQLGMIELRLPVRGEAGRYVSGALRGVGLGDRLEPVSIAGQGLEYLAGKR